MHIEADLDDIYTQRIALLQQSLLKALSEVLTMLIDWAETYSPENTVHLPETMTIDQWPDVNLSRDSLYGN